MESEPSEPSEVSEDEGDLSGGAQDGVDRASAEMDRLVLAGVNPVVAAQEAKRLMLLPTLEEQPILEPDQAPFGQPDETAESETPTTLEGGPTT